MEEEVDLRETKFKSPLPILIRVRNFIFGKEKPDAYTRITFYVNLVIWFVFLLWNVIGYAAIASREAIMKAKNVPVEAIIQKRGIELDFAPNDFVTRLMVVHGVGIICWLAVFLGLILLYRKREQFIYFMLGGVIFYLGLNVFYLSFQFFIEDTTSFDKVALLIMIASCVMHSYLMRKERLGGSISFFGEESEGA